MTETQSMEEAHFRTSQFIELNFPKERQEQLVGQLIDKLGWLVEHPSIFFRTNKKGQESLTAGGRTALKDRIFADRWHKPKAHRKVPTTFARELKYQETRLDLKSQCKQNLDNVATVLTIAKEHLAKDSQLTPEKRERYETAITYLEKINQKELSGENEVKPRVKRELAEILEQDYPEHQVPENQKKEIFAIREKHGYQEIKIQEIAKEIQESKADLVKLRRRKVEDRERIERLKESTTQLKKNLASEKRKLAAFKRSLVNKYTQEIIEGKRKTIVPTRQELAMESLLKRREGEKLEQKIAERRQTLKEKISQRISKLFPWNWKIADKFRNLSPKLIKLALTGLILGSLTASISSQLKEFNVQKASIETKANEPAVTYEIKQEKPVIEMTPEEKPIKVDKEKVPQMESKKEEKKPSTVYAPQVLRQKREKPTEPVPVALEEVIKKREEVKEGQEAKVIGQPVLREDEEGVAKREAEARRLQEEEKQRKMAMIKESLIPQIEKTTNELMRLSNKFFLDVAGQKVAPAFGENKPQYGIKTAEGKKIKEERVGGKVEEDQKTKEAVLRTIYKFAKAYPEDMQVEVNRRLKAQGIEKFNTEEEAKEWLTKEGFYIDCSGAVCYFLDNLSQEYLGKSFYELVDSRWGYIAPGHFTEMANKGIMEKIPDDVTKLRPGDVIVLGKDVHSMIVLGVKVNEKTGEIRLLLGQSTDVTISPNEYYWDGYHVVPVLITNPTGKLSEQDWGSVPLNVRILYEDTNIITETQLQNLESRRLNYGYRFAKGSYDIYRFSKLSTAMFKG